MKVAIIEQCPITCHDSSRPFLNSYIFPIFIDVNKVIEDEFFKAQ